MDRWKDAGALPRRTVLRGLGALGLTAAAASVGLGIPPTAAAERAPGSPLPEEKVGETLKRLFGDRPIQDGSGIMKLEAPLIAENGSVVPVTVEADVPMTPANHAKHIYIIADKNRRPLNAKFSLTPDLGRASIGANVRLATTTDVRAVLEMSDGSLFQVKQEVKVTIGGCGG